MRVLVWILILGAVLRLVFLNTVPPGISHDELDFVNNGYSLVKTGRDLAGDALPLTIGGVGHVALPAYLSGVSTFFFGLSLWSVRLVPAIWGILEIGIVYFICLHLFRSRTAALVSALLLTVSPWGLKISRAMFDPPTALFFYLLAIWVVVSALRPDRLVLATVFLGLGFVSYYGTIFTYPLALLSVLIFRYDLIKANPRILVPLSLVILFTGFIFYHMLYGGNQQKTTGRRSEVILSDTQKISDNVIFDRFHSTAPDWSDRLFVNKATYVFGQFAQNYFGAFSPAMIFITGDPNRIYSLWNRGELPLYTLPLIILGLVSAIRINRKGFWFLLSLLLISPLTSGFTSPVYATRAFLIWPVLIIFAGLGSAIVFSFLNRKNKFLRLSGFLLILSSVSYSLFSTFHQYFYRYPVYASEMWFESEKQLSNFLGQNISTGINIFAPEPFALFMEYIFYNQTDPADAQTALKTTPITLDSHTFIFGCPGVPDLNSSLIVFHTCSKPADSRALIRTIDKSDRVMWYSYNLPL